MSSLPVPNGPFSLAPWIVIAADPEVRVPPEVNTLAGFRSWAKSDSFPERGRISFLNQEIFIDLSPEELDTHGKVKMELGRVLTNWNKKRKLGEFYPDGTLVTNIAANLSTEPDATFVTWESFETGRVCLVPREGEDGQFIEVEGTPDWVLEIVSKSSVRKDTQRLRDHYHRAGIPEYWLIDARGEDLVFHIFVKTANEYVLSTARGGWQQSPLFGRRFRLVRQRGRLDHWEYTLQTRPLR